MTHPHWHILRTRGRHSNCGTRAQSVLFSNTATVIWKSSAARRRIVLLGDYRVCLGAADPVLVLTCRLLRLRRKQNALRPVFVVILPV